MFCPSSWNHRRITYFTTIYDTRILTAFFHFLFYNLEEIETWHFSLFFSHGEDLIFIRKYAIFWCAVHSSLKAERFFFFLRTHCPSFLNSTFERTRLNIFVSKYFMRLYDICFHTLFYVNVMNWNSLSYTPSI